MQASPESAVAAVSPASEPIAAQATAKSGSAAAPSAGREPRTSQPSAKAASGGTADQRQIGEEGRRTLGRS